MKVKYKGKNTVFDVDVCKNIEYDNFEQLCLSLSTFKLMPENERIAKIKEVYGNIKRVSTESGKDRHIKDVRQDSEGIRGGYTRTEQGPTVEGSQHIKSENKAKIQKREIRKKKGKNES